MIWRRLYIFLINKFSKCREVETEVLQVDICGRSSTEVQYVTGYRTQNRSKETREGRKFVKEGKAEICNSIME